MPACPNPLKPGAWSRPLARHTRSHLQSIAKLIPLCSVYSFTCASLSTLGTLYLRHRQAVCNSPAATPQLSWMRQCTTGMMPAVPSERMPTPETLASCQPNKTGSHGHDCWQKFSSWTGSGVGAHSLQRARLQHGHAAARPAPRSAPP
jgi:hypothetical protein